MTEVRAKLSVNLSSLLEAGLDVAGGHADKYSQQDTAAGNVAVGQFLQD